MFQPSHRNTSVRTVNNLNQQLLGSTSGHNDINTAMQSSTTTHGTSAASSALDKHNDTQHLQSDRPGQRTHDQSNGHDRRSHSQHPHKSATPLGAVRRNPTLTGPDDHYHIPYTYDVSVDHNPNNPYRPPSPRTGPDVCVSAHPTQCHDLYWCLEFGGEYSRRTLSTISRYLQPGYWTVDPEPGSCAYFVRVRSFDGVLDEQVD